MSTHNNNGVVVVIVIINIKNKNVDYIQRHFEKELSNWLGALAHPPRLRFESHANSHLVGVH